MARVGNFLFDVFVAIVTTIFTIIPVAALLLIAANDWRVMEGLRENVRLLKRAWLTPFESWRLHG